MARCWVGDVGVDIPAPRTEDDAARDRPARGTDPPEPAGNEPAADPAD